jgi:methanogenic corrinoid protein MtbC1
MGSYKISDLENLSGVKAHTIRIWEQRYKILVPLRTSSNIRLYDDEQLRKLLNVVSLINAGGKISVISKLNEVAFNHQLSLLIQSTGKGIKEGVLINQLLSAGLAYDERAFEKAFSIALLSFGIIEAYQSVFYPMLNKIGFLWLTSGMTPSQEHFVSNLMKQKIFAAIEALNPAKHQLEKWVLFLPEGERHDIGLLIANYCLRAKGLKVVYLGENIPVENLFEVAENVKATHYLTFLVKQFQETSFNDYLDKMSLKFGDPKIYICGNDSLAETLNLSPNQQLLTNFEDFQNLIQ